MAKRIVTATTEQFNTRATFAIARHTYTYAEVVTVTVEQDGKVGRGEGYGVYYHDETPATLHEDIARAAPLVEDGATRADLLEQLPPGGARCALDAALWDLEAKLSGIPVAQRLAADGRPLPTTMTIGIAEPSVMAEAARVAHSRLLKIKLSGEGDLERIDAIRRAVPDHRLMVDANQSWANLDIERHIADLVRFGVELVEQPVPAGEDALLQGLRRTIPICADESVQDRGTLEAVRGLYDYVNVKLDKTGGLTEALIVNEQALAMGFKLMTGCMLNTSLGIAPAYYAAGQSDFVDLDSPLLLAEDRDAPVQYADGRIVQPSAQLWG